MKSIIAILFVLFVISSTEIGLVGLSSSQVSAEATTIIDTVIPSELSANTITLTASTVNFGNIFQGGVNSYTAPNLLTIYANGGWNLAAYGNHLTHTPGPHQFSYPLKISVLDPNNDQHTSPIGLPTTSGTNMLSNENAVGTPTSPLDLEPIYSQEITSSDTHTGSYSTTIYWTASSSI